MVVLDVDCINRYAPYSVRETNLEGMFEFVTDYGVRFNVGFQEVENLLSYGDISISYCQYRAPKVSRRRKIAEYNNGHYRGILYTQQLCNALYL